MNCLYCKNQIDEKYIIDTQGEHYCSEECMEQYCDENNIAFNPHPYEETYLMLRNNYIGLLEQWEGELNRKTENLEAAVDELFEEIDELIGSQYDFILSEGDDGPHAWEIYQYTIKLRELQQRIFVWRPVRKKLYWLTSDHGNCGDLSKAGEEVYEKIGIDLYLAGYEEFILYVIKHHQHPYHWGLNYIFDNKEMAKEAHEVLKPVCVKRGVVLSIVESHKCESHCGDILEADADTYINGWFYCYPCKESGKHGIFTQQELEDDLRYYEENEEERQVVIFERRDWCVPFKEKIKRSCRAFEVEVPSWVE